MAEKGEMMPGGIRVSRKGGLPDRGEKAPFLATENTYRLLGGKEKNTGITRTRIK